MEKTKPAHDKTVMFSIYYMKICLSKTVKHAVDCGKHTSPFSWLLITWMFLHLSGLASPSGHTVWGVGLDRLDAEMMG
jgi:hypothetical protein